MSAFEITPPTITLKGKKVTLRPIGRGINRIINQINNIDDETQKASALLIAYAAIYSLPPAEALQVVSDEKAFNQAVGEADMEISAEDLALVDEYVSGVFSRANAAKVEVDTTPGKPMTEETNPAT